MSTSHTPPTVYSVLVAGAGPAGLTAATALAREGHSVTVLERHPELQSPGGPLTVQTAASKGLFHLGCKDILAENSIPMDKMIWWSYKAEAPLAVVGLGGADGKRRATTTRSHRVNRPLLQRVMHAVAVENGVRVEFGRNVVRLEEEEERGKVRVWTADGAEWTADLVVGADGIKSAVRRLIFPTLNVDPIPTAERVFLTQVPVPVLNSDPRFASTPLMTPDAFSVTMGPGLFHNTSYHASGAYAMTLTAVHYGPPAPVDGTWNTPVDPAHLQKLFAGFNEPTRAYLEHVEKADMWQMAYGRTLERWRSVGGRVVLIGDAAHAMLPHKAQGVSQGIEDAVALGHLIRWAPEPDKMALITEAYERIRRPRVETIVKGSLENMGRNTLLDGPEQEARDAVVRKMTGGVGGGAGGARPEVDWDAVVPDPEAPQRSPAYEKWESEYDVVAEVERFMASWRP